MTKKRKTKPTKWQNKRSKKATYRVRNWAAYNQSLVQRGSLTIWISEDVLDAWHPKPEGPRLRGGQVHYSDQAIECMLTLRAVYQLPYRQTEECGQSIMDLLGVDVTAGEWKVRQHGYSKRRTWRKLHLSVDETTHEIQAVELTEARVDDAEAGRQLLHNTPGPIDQVSGDGSYDKRKFYDTCTECEVDRIVVPPRRNARIWQHGNSSTPPLPRDQNLRRIRRVGHQRWKQESGYHRRSLAETAMFRFKIIFGNTLSSRSLSRQVTEARIKCAALNRMTLLGMPESYVVA